MTMTNLLGATVTLSTLSGVIGESWVPMLRGTVRGVSPEMDCLLVQVTHGFAPEVPVVGSLIRMPTYGGSKERVTVYEPPVAPETPEAEVH